MIQVKQNHIEDTANEAGLTLRILRQHFTAVVLTKEQLELISKLHRMKLGFADIENFLGTVYGKLKSHKFKVNFKQRKTAIIESMMKEKLTDAEEAFRKAKKEKEKIRLELNARYGINSRRSRNIVRKLNKEMRQLTSDLQSKNNKKITWLLKKYRDSDENDFTMPTDLNQLWSSIKVFDPKYEIPDSVKEDKPTVAIIGEINPPLDEDELACLSLPPKTAVNPAMSKSSFKTELGLCSTKVRWEIGKEEEEKEDEKIELTEEEENLMEELDSKSRLPYDPILGELDLRKRKVTDTKDNSKVFMPKPLSVKEEA